ncbi:MAG: TraB/GumN family protein [Candidatus Diapherotrites archaeon]|nr:TraB/GumN family protein [Candidatus Diapherotrites archaeon]
MDIYDIKIGDKHIRIVGTGHVIKQSIKTIEKAIEEFNPEVICVELDMFRVINMRKKRKPSIKQAVSGRNKLQNIIYFLLFSLQKRAGKTMGMKPGADMMYAINEARRRGIPIFLIDRDIRETMEDMMKSMSFLEKMRLIKAIFLGFFEMGDKEAISTVVDQKEEIMREFKKEFPSLYYVLVTKRNRYIAENILSLPNKRIMVVIGAGHVPGVIRNIQSRKRKFT